MKVLTILILTAVLAGQALADGHTHDCDRLAAHPSDPDKVGVGVGSGEVRLAAAIKACRDAVTAHPDEARFHYQLGRMLVYWAGANGADSSEGAGYVADAAAMGHTQAEFVHGLLLRADPANACQVEAMTRRAADKGLKSARLTYADDYLAGRYDGCDGVADTGAIRGYLDAVASQVSGYYEGMLRNALLRALEATR
ncbi:MAG: hypothetical protein AAFX58_01730 [Pseudomonadota bacterium]